MILFDMRLQKDIIRFEIPQDTSLLEIYHIGLSIEICILRGIFLDCIHFKVIFIPGSMLIFVNEWLRVDSRVAKPIGLALKRESIIFF